MSITDEQLEAMERLAVVPLIEEVRSLRAALTAARSENTILRDRLSTALADLHTARYELAKTRKP